MGKKKIVLFSRDPGGANAILPLVSKLSDIYEVMLLGKEYSLEKYQQYGIEKYKDIDSYEEECSVQGLKNILLKIAPDVVITSTSLDDFTERYMWKAAESLAIPSIAILDQWMNLGIRFSDRTYKDVNFTENKCVYMPTLICTMDEKSRQSLINDGIDGSRIYVSGQPYFEEVKDRFHAIRKEEIREYKLEKNMEGAKIFLFASEPISQQYGTNNHLGYTEQTIFKALCEELERRTEQIDLIVRPHPRENLKEWNKLFAENKSNHLKILLDDRSRPPLFMIKTADVICGMSSMMLIESALCEKDILSIQINLKCSDPFILSQMGIVDRIESKEQLSEHMQKVMKNSNDKIKVPFEQKPIEKIINIIKKQL